MYSESERAYLWLSAFSGLDPKEGDLLLDLAGSPENLFRNFENFSEDVIKSGRLGLYKKGSLSEREAQVDGLIGKLGKENVFAVARSSEDYPVGLSSIDAAPFVLYGAGERSLLRERIFCIVGSRRTPPWAEELGSRVAAELCEEFAVATGLAEGGDLAAIRGSLPSGKTISVLPCGIDGCYPSAHASVKREIVAKGLVLSELPFGETTKRYSFYARNRILAGLSEGVLAVSAGERSGALITAGFAADFGREVFAFPYSPVAPQGAGCNALIKNGAYLCTGAQDILPCFGFAAKESEKIQLSEEERRIMETLLEGELHIAAIAEKSGMELPEVSALLSALELKGLVVKAGANRFSILKV